MNRRNRLAAELVLALAVVAGCSRSTEQGNRQTDGNTGGPLSVYVVNYPLQYFAERIGGEDVDVHFPAPADEDPAYWRPNAETVAEYQQADLILLNGAGYAAWTAVSSLPDEKLCDTSSAFSDELISVDGLVTHSHGPEGEHAHGGVAFTTWLDPQLAVRQAEAVCEALKLLRPENAETFQQNYKLLQEDLEQLHHEIAAVIGVVPQRSVIMSHPVYQYLARRYELNARSVHWEPDAAPTDVMWEELQQMLADHSAKWMIWEGQPLDTTAERLSAIGVDCAVFAPCGNRPRSGDYLTAQRANVANLARVFEASNETDE